MSVIITTIEEEDISNNILNDISDDISDDFIEKYLPQKRNIFKQNTATAFNLGILGIGKIGSNISKLFHDLGYLSLFINHDEYKEDNNDYNINYISNKQKLFLPYTKEIISKNTDKINKLVNDNFKSIDFNILCIHFDDFFISEIDLILDILLKNNKPIIVIGILPSVASNDIVDIINRINEKINNLILIDSNKANLLNLKYDDFNKLIIEPIDTFNKLCVLPSIQSLELYDCEKLFKTGLSVYSTLKVPFAHDRDTAIAESINFNLNNNLLFDNFELNESKYVGIIISANKDIWSKISENSINYAMSVINDQYEFVYKGVYPVDYEDDLIRLHIIFSGLNFSYKVIEKFLNDEYKEKYKVKEKVKEKIEKEPIEKPLTAAEKIKNKIYQKSSISNRVIDRRS